MRYRFALPALSPLASVHLLLLQHNSRPLRVRKGGADTVVALSATRERRTNAGDLSSSDQERQLISNEEAARQKRSGQAKRRREKRARMENRVSYLESLAFNNNAADDDGVGATPALSDAQRKELEGLLKIRDSFEEQYDPTTFSEAHVEFKRMHNDAFVALARYCQRDRLLRRSRSERDGDHDGNHHDRVNGDEKVEDPNVFYLDGPDGATSSVLEESGFDPSCCYVANRHLSTCQILRNRLPKENVVHCTAAEALTPNNVVDRTSDDAVDTKFDRDPSFSDVDFSAYYFDGCGGFVPHIVGMMTAALIRPDASSPEQKQEQQPKTTAIGFSLMGGNRDVVEKELAICRALAIIARSRGMRTRHVLDDPGRYGIHTEISKISGGTFTSWMLLEEESMLH